MISFERLGQHGRLGNQLFQYAFIREMANKLKTQFYCPHWDGDVFFDLNDASLRADSPQGISHHYNQGAQAGFSASALEIKDHTEIVGFFQSTQYYEDESRVKSWFSFRDDIKHAARGKFPEIDFSRCVSLSLRADKDYADTREFFPLYSMKYYQSALEHYDANATVVVFADKPDLARVYFRDLSASRKVFFIENATPIEQLYLMSICGHGNVVTNSTFAWWGGFLNQEKGAKICAPTEWTRPGVSCPIEGIIPKHWLSIPSLHPIYDNFQVWRLRHPVKTIRRVLDRFLGKSR
jgi:hypothetical protein